jgi:hypothetical protein
MESVPTNALNLTVVPLTATAAVVPCCPKPFYKLNKIIFQSK